MNYKVKPEFDTDANNYKASCVGFFAGKSFTLLELKAKQDEIYEHWKIADGDKKNALNIQYSATEAMRVKLLQLVIK